MSVKNEINCSQSTIYFIFHCHQRGFKTLKRNSVHKRVACETCDFIWTESCDAKRFCTMCKNSTFTGGSFLIWTRGVWWEWERVFKDRPEPASPHDPFSFLSLLWTEFSNVLTVLRRWQWRFQDLLNKYNLKVSVTFSLLWTEFMLIFYDFEALVTT